MDRIIIFTNWQRIYQLQDRYELNWEPESYPPQKIPVSNDKSFIIAWDAMPIFTDLVKLVDNNANIYVLHHNSPDNAHLESLNNLLSAKGCEVTMVHKQTDHAEYKMIQDINACVMVNFNSVNPNIIDLIEVTDKQKLIRTFETLKGMLSGNPKLEVALDFLHECLVGVPKLPEQIDANYGMHMYDGTDFNGSIEDLYNTWKNSPSDYTKLSELRNALLKWAEDK